jgi:hypothetical protein
MAWRSAERYSSGKACDDQQHVIVWDLVAGKAATRGGEFV